MSKENTNTNYVVIALIAAIPTVASILFVMSLPLIQLEIFPLWFQSYFLVNQSAGLDVLGIILGWLIFSIYVGAVIGQFLSAIILLPLGLLSTIEAIRYVFLLKYPKYW